MSAKNASKEPIEIFMPPNLLKAKVGGSAVGLDMGAVARAEKAFESLKSEFADWFSADVDKLCHARAAFAADPDKAARDAFYRAGHDLKGQALTFGYPLAARIAASLCRLLETGIAVKPLIDAHVNAIRAIVRAEIKEDGNAVGKKLADELEARVTEVVDTAKRQ